MHSKKSTFGVNELVHQAGISHYRLKRRLKAITNKSVKQFLREVCLQKALEILEQEEVHVSEVAYRVGFASPAYFNTCFHEHFGYPPGTVKKGDFVNTIETDALLAGQNKKIIRALIRFSAGLLVFTVIACLVYFFVYQESTFYSGLAVHEKEKSIAVLPFKNLNDSLANQYFIDGIMEEIHSNLGSIAELRLVSRTSVE